MKVKIPDINKSLEYRRDYEKSNLKIKNMNFENFYLTKFRYSAHNRKKYEEGIGKHIDVYA
jgi:hypothetical protein